MVKIIENYALHEQIGEGEYGKVYRGIDTRTKSQIAVKVINVKKFKEYPKLQECTLNQIQILSKIECPYIIRFLQILKTANNFYFFYQFCNGGTLESYIKQNGPLTQKKVLQYLNQMIQAFKILASRNIMHRDLKPSNILLHEEKIKLGDFGFCKTLQNSKDLAQTMLGSPIYMAPQVLKGQIYTIKADIWSLGVVIYEMIYGFCPFEQSSIARLINVLDTRQVNFNSDINKVSSQLIDLVKKMLVKDHFKRISWQQIFEYDILNGCIKKNDKNILQLRQNRQWQNILNRPKSKASTYEFDYSQQKQQNLNTSAKKQTTAFTKKNSSYKENKQNSQIKVQKTTDTLAAKNHQKLTAFVKYVFEMIELDVIESLTIPLAIKLYELILKQHGKLPNKEQYRRQRNELSQIIRVFQQQAKLSNNGQNKSSGPLLNSYIKQIKNNCNSLPSEQRLRVFKNCVKLLDMNEIGAKQLRNYEFDTEEQLMNEIKLKSIKNSI